MARIAWNPTQVSLLEKIGEAEWRRPVPEAFHAFSLFVINPSRKGSDSCALGQRQEEAAFSDRSPRVCFVQTMFI